MATRFAWSFAVAFQPFALPTVEASFELVEDDAQPAPAVDQPEQDHQA